MMQLRCSALKKKVHPGPGEAAWSMVQTLWKTAKPSYSRSE